MKNIIKITAYSAVALSSVAYTNVSAVISVWNGKVKDTLKWNWNKSITDTINNILGYLFGFLYIIAFVLILWAGAQILTAAWDEEKVKKWKTIMIQAAIGLVVIFLASQITDLFFGVTTWQELNPWSN
jgi:type IV secretory pathway VirB2 component (pilin)